MKDCVSNAFEFLKQVHIHYFVCSSQPMCWQATIFAISNEYIETQRMEVLF